MKVRQTVTLRPTRAAPIVTLPSAVTACVTSAKPVTWVPPIAILQLTSLAAARCAARRLCGNGQTDAGEECDDGAGNSDTTAGACRTSCQKATCGDGVIDPNEVCDDGKANSDTQPDKCRTDCTAATCGDGVKDSDEACDGEDDCDGECNPPGCGDGVVEEGVEECDDGALTSEYGGCAAECRLAPHCGDGNTDDEFEECDDGADNQDDTYGKCRKDCTFGERCGDGVVQDQEQCDGGGECNASCEFGACSSGQLRCGSEAMCVDPKTNAQFCGASGDCQGDNDGYTCPSDAQCTNGSCKMFERRCHL